MKLLAALILCLSLVVEAAPSSGKVPRGRASASSTSAARRSPVPNTPASPWVVDIRELVPSLRPMPQKEVEDQLRDWALYGLLMRLGLGADELARTTHQLAPVRLPYLEELFAFEYGQGRRAILSDERVLLLYEQDDPDPQATLGRLADRVRMELGRVPDSFELYTFASDVTAGELRLEFQEAVSGLELFSRKYGYSQRVITSPEEFARWLNAVDDVVYVAQVPEGLRLGGRRFEKSRTRGVSLEDVAVLYQAHSELAAQKREQLQQVYDPQFRRLRELSQRREDRIELSGRRGDAQRFLLPQSMEDSVEAFERMVRRVPLAPGFSLDPALDKQGLVDALDALAVDPCRALVELNTQARASVERLEHTKAWPGLFYPAVVLFRHDNEELRKQCEALKEDPYYSSRIQRIAAAARGLLSGASEVEALEPLYALKNEVKDAKEGLEHFISDVLNLVEEAHRRQCARYDGPLGGTRVGMNLFYTDLLAKLWSLDVNNEAPGLRVPGFLSMARLPDSLYEEDLKKAATRLWFGPRKEAFTRSPQGSELRFQHVATRVFAAGSDANQLGGEEGSPNEQSRRALGWWERHYADVADYEQEYHLQNQIMKWSVITGFFHEQELAPYLEQVPVFRTLQFGEWYVRNRPQLKYQLPLVVEGAPSKECMDILSTRSGLSGGVSLSGGRLDQVPVVKPHMPANLRHSLEAMTAGEPVAKALGRTFPTHEGAGVIRVEPLPGTKTRMSAFQLELGTVELAHARSLKGEYRLTLRTQQAPVGDFRSTEMGDRLQLSWHPREIAEAPALARRATRKEGAIPVAVTRYPGTGSKNTPFHPWDSPVLVAEEFDVLVPAATGNAYKRIHLTNGARAHRAPASLPSVLDPYPGQQLTADRAASGLETTQGVIRRPVKTGPGPNARQVEIVDTDGSPVGLTVYAEDSGLFFPRPLDAQARKSWYALDRFTQKDLVTIQEAARRGDSTVSLKDLSDPRADKAIRALVAEDRVQFRRLHTALSRELGPERAQQELQQHLEAAAEFQLAKGDSRRASQLYELARQHFGEASPKVLIQQTVAEVHRGAKPPSAISEVVARHASKLSQQEGMRAVKATQGLEDMPDVAEVLRAKLGFKSSIPDEVAPRIHWERDGPDVVSTYHFEKRIRLENLAPDEFKQGVPKDANIYVEDGVKFNKQDFQLNPSENMAELLGHNPQVDVKRLGRMETDKFRPGTIYATDDMVQIAPKEGAAQAPAPERVYRRVAGPSVSENPQSRIYLIRMRPDSQCDTNGDGQVSDEERQLCKAA